MKRLDFRNYFLRIATYISVFFLSSSFFPFFGAILTPTNGFCFLSLVLLSLQNSMVPRYLCEMVHFPPKLGSLAALPSAVFHVQIFPPVWTPDSLIAGTVKWIILHSILRGLRIVLSFFTEQRKVKETNEGVCATVKRAILSPDMFGPAVDVLSAEAS